VLPAYREGKKIRRWSWNQDNNFGKNSGGILYFSGIDLASDDWEIVEEPKAKVKRWLWVVFKKFSKTSQSYY
jgi:hypothetical protein